jgi:hypothetical protein
VFISELEDMAKVQRPMLALRLAQLESMECPVRHLEREHCSQAGKSVVDVPASAKRVKRQFAALPPIVVPRLEIVAAIDLCLNADMEAGDR